MNKLKFYVLIFIFIFMKIITDKISGPQGYKAFFILNSHSQLSMKFILLINVKMPTIVGILD